MKACANRLASAMRPQPSWPKKYSAIWQTSRFKHTPSPGPAVCYAGPTTQDGGLGRRCTATDGNHGPGYHHGVGFQGEDGRPRHRASKRVTPSRS